MSVPPSSKPSNAAFWSGDLTEAGALPPISLEDSGPTPSEQRAPDAGDGPVRWAPPPMQLSRRLPSSMSTSLARSKA